MTIRPEPSRLPETTRPAGSCDPRDPAGTLSPPMTPEQARQRLRQAAANCDEQFAFAASPFVYLAAAAALGLAVGLSPNMGSKLKAMALSLLKLP